MEISTESTTTTKTTAAVPPRLVLGVAAPVIPVTPATVTHGASTSTSVQTLEFALLTPLASIPWELTPASVGRDSSAMADAVSRFSAGMKA